jgi:hypothetical protein
MVEEKDKVEDAGLQVCSLDSFDQLCKKNSKILLIATADDRSDFARKFKDAISTDGVTIVPVKAGGPCEIIGKLGLTKPTAVFIEEGKVKRSVPLQDDDVKNTASLIKVLSEKPSEVGSCEAKLTVDGKGWGIKLEPGSNCEKEMANFSKLPEHVQKYMSKHMEK